MLAARTQRKKALKQPTLATSWATAEQSAHSWRWWWGVGLGHCSSLSVKYNCEVAYYASILKPGNKSLHLQSHHHCNGARSSSMVGMNSETVG
jgi:hypothetical protein